MVLQLIFYVSEVYFSWKMNGLEWVSILYLMLYLKWISNLTPLPRLFGSHPPAIKKTRSSGTKERDLLFHINQDPPTTKARLPGNKE